MSKPASKTVSYVVYSPNYVPGKGKLWRAKQKADAIRMCRKIGPGAEFVRYFSLSNRRRSTTFPEARPWVFYGPDKKAKP